MSEDLKKRVACIVRAHIPPSMGSIISVTKLTEELIKELTEREERLIEENAILKGSVECRHIERDINNRREAKFIKALKYYANGGDWVGGEVDQGKVAKHTLKELGIA